MNDKGFTVMELMIILAILGIVAAVVIPAWQDYQKTGKVQSQLEREADACEAKNGFLIYDAVGKLRCLDKSKLTVER